MYFSIAASREEEERRKELFNIRRKELLNIKDLSR